MKGNPRWAFVAVAMVALLVPSILAPGAAAGAASSYRYSWNVRCTAHGPAPNSARGAWVWLDNGSALSRGGTKYTSCPGTSSGGGTRPSTANGIRITFGACARALCHVAHGSARFSVGAPFSLTVRLNVTTGSSGTMARLVLNG